MNAQKQVWVDTDLTIGHRNGLIGFCDVDDGYAITALLRSQEVEVMGISSTLGNGDDIKLTTQLTKQFIANYGPNSVEVFQGQPEKLRDNKSTDSLSDGVKQLAEALREDRLTILSIGSATNIASLLLNYPELEAQIDEVIVVAGRRNCDQHFVSGHWQPKPFRDLNFEYDVHAYEVLLKSKLDLTLVPYEVCNKIWIQPHDLVRLGEANNVGRFLAEHSLGWMIEWEALFGANGFNPFDMVAAGYAINPDFFTYQEWDAVIETAPDDTGRTSSKPYLLCSENIRSGRKVRYCTDVNSDCKPFLLDRICTHDMSAFVLGMSHINVVVPDLDEASAFYQRVLGFKQACDQDGKKMDYQGVEMKPFALDAGMLNGEVNVDVRFLKHPQAGLYLELMKYHQPAGTQNIPLQPKTFDVGGPRHIAMEVSNCNEVFNYLKQQEGVTMINTNSDYHPVKLDGFPITFFYWVDQYGIQWEMEEGRRVGTSKAIA